MTALANIKRLVHEAVGAALKPNPPVDYLAWAEANIVFDDASPFPGPWNRTLFPYFDEILRALSPQDPCRYVSFLASAQLGKTELSKVFALGSAVMSRGTTLVAHPTIENASRWSRLKLLPSMRSIPVVAEMFPQRSRDTADAILFKERKDGLANILISGANSPASLSQITVNYQVQDDLSRWEMNSSGDPEVQCDSRSRALEAAKIFKLSVPGVIPGCRITKDFEAGSQEWPYVPCPHCSEMMILEPDDFIATIDPERPGSAHFTCSSCGGVIEERHRPQMLAGFEWHARNPAMLREHRSFCLWSAYSYLQSWLRIEQEYLKSKGDSGAEQTFSCDTLGRAFRAQGEAPPWEVLRDRAALSHYSRGTSPRGSYLHMLAIDCQTTFVAWQLVGFGPEFRRYVIDAGTIGRHISDVNCQRNLDLLLARRWKDTAGQHEFVVDFCGIDGNYATEDVWSWARRYPANKVIMTRGASSDTAPRIALVKRERNAAGKILARSRRFYNIGTNYLKMSLYRDLLKADPNEPGFVSFPRDLEDSYFQELTSERRVPIKYHGFTKHQWQKDANQPNEQLDCMIIATAAAIRYGAYSLSDHGWDALRERRGIHQAPIPAPKPAPTPAPELSDEESLHRIREMFAKNPQMLKDPRAQAVLKKAKAAGYDIEMMLAEEANK